MNRISNILFGVGLLLALGLHGVASAQHVALPEVVAATFQKHCLKCHGAVDEAEGEVSLVGLDTAAGLSRDLQLLRDLIDVLDSRLMPPEDEPQPTLVVRETLVTELRELLRSAAANAPRPQTPIRRMNRFQYSNAVEDLFELKAEVFALPERMLREHGNYFQPASGKMPETLNAGSRPLGKSQLIGKRLEGVAPFPQDLRAEHGFDNRGDHLSLSPLLLESFLKLSRSIIESRDFNEKTCGIWNQLFAPPARSEDQTEAIRHRLDWFLQRAFRGPIDEHTLDRYGAYVSSRLDSGQSFSKSMKEVASTAIASPRFLYLYDRVSDEHGQSLSDFELASRLSFFLWGSIPDQTLLDLAAEGKLQDPVTLREQVQRMLHDRRLKRFCDSFPPQWLQLERIVSSVPDRERFPEFYFAKFRVSMHMMLEPLLLFETVLVENRSILDLVDSHFSYRSELLESWYRDGTQSKKTPPTSIPFRRVAVSDRREGGVITSAAVMTMTSAATRTQPITRGAWIASVIFNDPPDPPPADVPPLTEDDTELTANLTLRERLAAHRDRTDCAGCHAQIDPLGFALENYGPTGIWREMYDNGRPVDASGVLFGKHQFADIAEFKDAILAEKDRFARAFAAHLLSFALGRQMDPVDEPALEKIVSETAAEGFRLQSMIQQIVMSEPFLTKSNPAQPENRLP